SRRPTDHILPEIVSLRTDASTPMLAVQTPAWRTAMPRLVRNAKLDTRSARAKLPARREPYWVVMVKGAAVGYRRGKRGGTWIARWRDDQGLQRYQALGVSDDSVDADGVRVLTFAQAQEKARAWFARTARVGAGYADGPYTVADAIRDYL